MYLFFNDREEDFGYMMEGYKNGTITEERLNDALHRILGVKAALGPSSWPNRGNKRNIMAGLDFLASFPGCFGGFVYERGQQPGNYLLLGSLVYTAFGLKPVMYAGVVCFFFTACFECLIKVKSPEYDKQEGKNPLLLVKKDFLDSLRLITRERPAILKIFCVTSVIMLLIQGVSAVGFPYIIRNVLG